METFNDIVTAIVDWLKIEFTLYGHTISLWALLCYTLLASFILWFITKIFDFGG